MEYKEKERELEKMETGKPNLTGIPTRMKLDFERRSGLPFDDVRVHYNSDKPAQIQAWAYTQGAQIYVAPGQERHLPHELGHIVQQKLEAVRPTGFIHGLPVNDQPDLEADADRLSAGPTLSDSAVKKSGMSGGVVQRKPQDYSKMPDANFIQYALRLLDPNRDTWEDGNPFSSEIVTGGSTPETDSQARSLLFLDLGRIKAGDLSNETFMEELSQQGIEDQEVIDRVCKCLSSLLPAAAEEEAASSPAGPPVSDSTIQVPKYKEALRNYGSGLYYPEYDIIIYDSTSEKIEQYPNMEDDYKRFEASGSSPLRDADANIEVTNQKTYARYVMLLHELGHRRQQVNFNGKKRDIQQISKSRFLKLLLEYENILYHENLMPQRMRKGYNGVGMKGRQEHKYFDSEDDRLNKSEDIELDFITSICGMLKNIDLNSALDVLTSLEEELDLNILLNDHSAAELIKTLQEINHPADITPATTGKTVSLISKFMRKEKFPPQNEKIGETIREETKEDIKALLVRNRAQILPNLQHIVPVLENPNGYSEKEVTESLEALGVLEQSSKEIYRILTGPVFRQTSQTPDTTNNRMGGLPAEDSKPSKPQAPAFPDSPPPAPPMPPSLPVPREEEIYQKDFLDCIRTLSADDIAVKLLDQAAFPRKIAAALAFIRKFSNKA